MLYLKCTGKVQHLLKLTEAQLTEPRPTEAVLGDWYVDHFLIARTQALIFMSETTLLSFIMFKGKRTVDAESLPAMFMTGLEQLLDLGGFDAPTIARALKLYSPCRYAKTESRSALGSMTDLVDHYQQRIARGGGLAQSNLTDIVKAINDMPQRRMEWASSWSVARKSLAPG